MLASPRCSGTPARGAEAVAYRAVAHRALDASARGCDEANHTSELAPHNLPPVTSPEPFADEPLEVALVASTDHAVIVADPDGLICFWNAAAETIFGHSRADALGESLDIIVPEQLRARHWDGYRHVMRTGQTQYAGRTLAVPAIRRDGTRISVEFTVSLLYDASGALRGIGGSCATSPRDGRSSAR